MKPEERIEVLEVINPRQEAWKTPFYYAEEQVTRTAKRADADYVFDENNDWIVKVRWAADVPLEERHRVMRDLVTLYNLRYGVGVS